VKRKPSLAEIVLGMMVVAGAGVAASGSEAPIRILFKNDLPPVRVQDPDAGIYFVKVSFFGDGPTDPNSGRPDFSGLPELKTITFGRPIEGKDLPGRVFDISKKDLEARKAQDPNTLIKNDRKKMIFEGGIPSGAAWVKIRYDTAIWVRKAGARNWLSFALPVLPEDRWVRLPPPAEGCPMPVITITALVKGVHEDEKDFTLTLESGCE